MGCEYRGYLIYSHMRYNCCVLQVIGTLGSAGIIFIIKYSSNESDVGFENSIMIRSPDSRHRTNISVPANFTGQQLQVQVTLSLIGRESASAPFIVGKSYYVAVHAQ